MFELSTTTILFLIIIITFLFFKWKFADGSKKMPPGPWGFAVVGHLPLFGDNPPEMFLKWREKYGDIYSIRLGSWKTIVVNGYDVVKEAAELPEDAFSGRPDFVSTKVMAEDFGDDFAFGNFSLLYMKQRKMAESAIRLFTTKRREEVFDLVKDEAERCAEEMLSKFDEEAGSIQFDIKNMVIRTQYQILYGRGQTVDTEKHVNVIRDALNDFNEFTGRGNPIDVLPWLQYFMPSRMSKFKNMLAGTTKLMNNNVNEHYQTFTREHIRDVTDAVLASKEEDKNDEQGFAHNSLMMVLLDFQGGGYDTSQTTIRWLLLYMAAYPEVQSKVHLELDKVKGQNGKVDATERSKLVYVDAVIHEVARKTSILPFAIPHYAIKDTTLRGFDVSAGTVVIFNLHSVHYEKEFWDDPHVFRPERFITPSNTLDKEKCKHVIPFGLGRRRCVGEPLAKMNVFTMFATIMKRCTVLKPPDTDLDLRPEQGLAFFPKDFKVIVRPRY